jgi:hypothetical protein
LNEYTAIAIRRATEKEVFLGVHKELRTAIPMCEFDEETHPHDVFDVEQRDRERAAEILALLEAYGDELVEVVLATHAGDESLQELVDRKCPGMTASQRAFDAYCRAQEGLVWIDNSLSAPRKNAPENHARPSDAQEESR